MKILFVAPYLPSPPRFGGQRRMDGLMRGLAANHEVSILSFNSTDQWTQESLDATRLFCRNVTTLSDLDPRGVRERRQLQMRSLLSLHSFEHLQVKRRADFQKTARRAPRRAVEYDIVQVEFANMASYRLSRGADEGRFWSWTSTTSSTTCNAERRARRTACREAVQLAQLAQAGPRRKGRLAALRRRRFDVAA